MYLNNKEGKQVLVRGKNPFRIPIPFPAISRLGCDLPVVNGVGNVVPGENKPTTDEVNENLLPVYLNNNEKRRVQGKISTF